VLYGIGEVVDEYVIVNGVVVLLVIGGFINYMIYFVVMVVVVGIELIWEDFDDLFCVVLLCMWFYLSGIVDVNYFYVVGGMLFFVGMLFDVGLLYGDVFIFVGLGFDCYCWMLWLDDDGVFVWYDVFVESGDFDVLCLVFEFFVLDGGLCVLCGLLGYVVVKVLVVVLEYRVVEVSVCVFVD